MSELRVVGGSQHVKLGVERDFALRGCLLGIGNSRLRLGVLLHSQNIL
jgi:hypothetical protein